MSKITLSYQSATQSPYTGAYREISRRRWYEHVIYTRNTILSMMSNGPDAAASAARLLKNQNDIGGLLRPFYPADKVDEIVVLLKDHIKQAGDIVTATMASEDTTQLIAQWRANCQEIVQKLVDLNPLLDKTTLSNLWDRHLNLTIAEIEFRRDKNWKDDIANFDKIMDNIQEIANVLVDKTLQQFPEKI